MDFRVSGGMGVQGALKRGLHSAHFFAYGCAGSCLS